MSLLHDSTSRLLINGELVAGSAGTFAVHNPATEEVVGHAAEGTATDMDAAIEAARTAFDTTDWAHNHELRARCIRQLRDALQNNLEEIRELTIAEVGAPKFLTSGPHLEGPIEDLGYFAELAETYTWDAELGESVVMGVHSTRRTQKEAVGVVGAITPWNFPHQINFAKIGPALAAGCTVVLKPAPDTPLCAAVLGELITEHTDFPAGVINIVTSTDHQIGAMLSEDPRVDLVSFTGSTATGKKVMQAASSTLKKVFLELGGKSAFIVLDDADFNTACSMAAISVSTHAGQGCAITTRLLVPASRYDEAVAITKGTLSGITAGDPATDGVMCGPLISQVQYDRVTGYIELAQQEGGTIECGGTRPEGLDKGYFVNPTLVSGLDNSSRTAQEEIFGPVLVIIPFEDDEDAIRIANDSPYGLSGAVWGTDPKRINHVVNSIRTGTMSINGGVWYGADAPFGGYKQSGIGREMGVLGFEEYLETKLIASPAN